WIEYNGNRYFSNSEGVLYRNRHIHFGYHDDYVMSADGSVVRGLFYEGNNRYYADINTGEIKKEARWIEYNGNRYFSNSEGVLYRNRHIHFGHHDDYIMRADGSVLRGFFYEGTDRYYADINTGEIRKEARWIEHDGNRYFSNGEGVLYRNRFIHFSTKSKYYMTSDGSVARTRFVLNNITYVPDSVTGEIMISPENQEGWFHKDGNKYYRNSDGSLATGYKDIEGFKYYFDDNGILKSKVVIDVSQWQNRINWSEVAKTPVSAAIIRSSYTGAASGKIVEDPNYRQNIAGAIEAGIEVGVYHYSQAITVEEAREEARKIFELSRGYNLTLPIFMDIEYYHDSGGYGRNYYITKQERTNIIKAFCDEVIRLGGKPVIYSYTSFLENEIYMGQLQNYPVWVAQYYHKVTYSGPFIGWQYSSKGRVNGINGDVDLNLFFTK
ncbi:Lyzozyme M1 (1,4-beta-N-acetylmuramidase), GH25 family, partial [Peptostreptococcaceae bacterium pGA-8]